MRKKYKIIILVILIIFLCSILVVSLHFTSTHKSIANEATNIEIENNNEVSNNVIESNLKNDVEEIKDIKIYDIEEGYLNVPYNPYAKKHTYNWDNLSKKQKYYKYDDKNYTSKFGIDVSEFQGEINWKKVKNAGVEFAFIRLGYRGYAGKGKLTLDNKFSYNLKQAVDNGISVGIYFFSQAINEKEAKQEAKYVLDYIKNKNITYPICFDLEKIKFDTARTDKLTSEEITNISIAFCEEIENAGYIPMIYGNAKTFTTRMKLEKLDKYKKWYADYQKIPLYPYEFEFWQYSEKGKVDGIDTNVDLNIQFIIKNAEEI